MRAGDISAIYIGEVIDAAPTPRPPTMRKMTNWTKVRGIAVPIAETRKAVAEEPRGRDAADASHQRARRGPALHRGVELEVRLEVADRAADDGGVVAEEKSAEGGHHADQRDVPRARHSTAGRPGHLIPRSRGVARRTRASTTS
jgi:hypothetical protein